MAGVKQRKSETRDEYLAREREVARIKYRRYRETNPVVRRPRRTPKDWSGDAPRYWRDVFARSTTWPTACGICTEPVNRDDRWQIDHIKPRHLHPELIVEPTNMRIVHQRCNQRSGLMQQAIIRVAPLCCTDCQDTLALSMNTNGETLRAALSPDAPLTLW